MFTNAPNKPIPSRIQSAPSTVGRVDKKHEEKKSNQIQRQSSCGDLITKVPARKVSEDSVNTRKGVRKLFPLKKFRARTGVYSLEENVNVEKRKESWVTESNPNVFNEDCLEESVETVKDVANIRKTLRTHSAPSTVGRLDEDHEEIKSCQIQRQSSCGDLIPKVLAIKISDESGKTRKGVRNLLPLKKFRARTGVYSLEENVNVEKRKESWATDSNPNVFKEDCSEESVETVKDSKLSTILHSLTRIFSVDENEGFGKLRRSWRKGKKSKIPIGECPERSVDVETQTGVPKLKCFTVNSNENAKSHTKSTIASVEQTKPFVLKRENPDESVKIKQDVPNPILAEESKYQTKFHSMTENTATSFDDSLKPLSTLGGFIREEKRILQKHPKSKTISIYERDSEQKLKSSVQYFYYNAKHFQHFQYIYNLMRDCHDRIEGLRRTNDRRNCMAEDVIIKIGIVGEFTEDKLNLLSKRRGKREMPVRNQQIWEQSPLLCFQKSTKSALKMLRREKACHKILVISDPNHKETEKVEDSIFIIREDKEHILRKISICLEEQIHEILQDWSVNLPLEGFGKHLPGIVAEIKDIRKQMLFDEHNQHITGASAFRGAVNETVVPSNVKEYLFGRSDVNSFGIWRNSSFKVFVKKTIDVKELENHLKKLHQKFFEKYSLEIVKGRLVALKSLKQGDCLIRKGKKTYAGTLGGFVTKTDDERKMYALTCNHVFDKENQLAYIDNHTDIDIGTCVYTTTYCDFAAIEIKESVSTECDIALRRDDEKEIGAKVYNESLEQITFVHKIGATTDVTKGSIYSTEYFDKLMPENAFLVKGIGKQFSEEGDSGSLVFSRPNTARQNYVNVVGMVFANSLTLYEDVDDDQNTENLSCCYRIHTAFDLFRKEKGVEVKFKDDLSTPSSSDDSYEEAS